ncbi:MAG: hypothetical protein LBL73_04595 [Synergistaceae bacterium]|jgi:hypothetical protein|nr:hypothetical protein [Synergistaceae bacterium]
MPARRGFSLITVLVISVVALGAVGVMMQFMSVSAGAGRTSSTINRDYNLLASEVENARAWLVHEVRESAPPGRINTAVPITSADMLLVSEDRRALSRRDLSLYGLGGSAGTLTVKIYDMNYEPGYVQITDEAEQRQMPPSVRVYDIDGGDSGDGEPTGPDDLVGGGTGGVSYDLTPSNGGTYLIRAYLEIDGVQSGTVDLALMASQ